MTTYSKGGHWVPTIPGCVCEHCGVTFVGRKKNPRFCSKSCSAKRTAKTVDQTERTCPTCKTVWTARAKNPSTFCCRACWQTAQVEKRKRDCVVCGNSFYVQKAGRVGMTCSEPCLRQRMAENSSGRKASDETRAKMSAIMKDKFSDPDYLARHKEITSVALKNWLSVPENAAKAARQSSERMKRRHADPEWQKVRDERSSRTMKATWENRRDEFTQMAVDRYAAGLGIASEESEQRRRVASKWIMTKAQEALHTETDYNQVYAEVQARLRREMPYDGPAESSDYYEYCQKLGRAVVQSPECREIADGFLSEAIPRFAKEWQRLKKEVKDASQVTQEA